MAKVLSNAGIVTGQPVEAHHVSQSVNALTAAEAYDVNISGSLVVNSILYPITDGVSGSVLVTDGAGVATFQQLNAVTASYITSSGVDGPFGMDSIASSSYAATASLANFATEASTSIFAINANTAINADTASIAITASYITASGVDGPYGLSSVESSSLAVTASYVSSSNVFGPFGLDSILSASFAITAAYAENAGGATIDTSSFVLTSSIAGFTQSFTLGDGSTYENYIQSASFATSASYALTASFIEMADAFRQDFTAVTTVTVNHNFGTEDILVQVYRDLGGATNPIMIIPDQIELTNNNTAVVTFPTPETGYVVVSDGGGIVSLADSASYATTASYALNADGVDQAVYTSSISGLTQSFTLGSGATYENYIQSASWAETASYVELNLTENFRGNFTNVTAFTATHAFDTEDILIQVYESSSLVSPPRQLTPASVTLDNLNQATVTFAAPTTGFIVINKNSGYISSGSTDFAQTASYVTRTQRNLQDGEGIIDFYFDGSSDALVTLDTASARFRNSTVLSSSFATSASFAQTASYLQGFITSASYAARAEKTSEVRLPIFNDDNKVIRKGDPVYVEEYDGTSYKVRRADALDANKMPAIGLSIQELAIGESGEALIVGEFKGLDTFGLPVGRNFYVASGSGWTTTVPAGPAQTQPLGVVAEESAIAGRLIVNGPVADIAIGGGMATTASYVSSSNVDGPFGMDSIQTASFAVTASYIELAQPVKADFVNQTTFVVTHGFDTENLNIDVYEDSAATGNIPEQIQPTSVRQINLNQVEINFASPTTGFVVVSKGGFLRLGTVENAESASYANRVPNNITDGKGIEDFTFNGSAAATVQLDTASAHFRNSTVLSSSFATSASFAITASYLTGEVESSSYARFADESKFTEDVRLPIINDDTASISKGDPVYVEEHDGSFYRIRIADAANPNKMPAIGVAMSDLGVGDSGSVLLVGDLEGLNTFGLIEGRNIYVATGSGWTQNIPTGTAQVQPIGVVAEESPTLGRVIINGPVTDLKSLGTTNRYTEAIAGSNTYTITHNLANSLPIVQSYDTTGLQVLPSVVQILTANSIQVTYASIFNGNIIVQI